MIPAGSRVLSVRTILSSIGIENITFDIQLYGLVNSTTTENQVIINSTVLTTQSSIGDVATTSFGSTTLGGGSILNAEKVLVSLWPRLL